MNRYICLLRPASSFTLPQGLKWDYAELPRNLEYTTLNLRRPELPLSKYAHGVIETERPLTLGECERFDLRPVASALPVDQRLARIEKLVREAVGLPDEALDRCAEYARILYEIRLLAAPADSRDPLEAARRGGYEEN